MSVPSLIDAIWQEEASSRRVNNLQFHVSRLRTLLREIEPDSEAPRLVTQLPGYRLIVDDRECDLHVFQQNVSQARSTAESRPGDAGLLYRKALSLWRGPALSDVRHASGRLGAEGDRLDEMYLSALEERLDSDLASRPPSQSVSHLINLISQYPRRERLRCQLMIALYRCGRESEALETYARYRLELREGFGLDPGPQLQRVHQQVLAHAGELLPRNVAAAPTAARPEPKLCQLPPDLPDFTGRSCEVAETVRAVRACQQTAGQSVIVISGAPGIGKTSLALHIGHTLRSVFPDGQLYVPLAGTSQLPRDPTDIIGGVLSAFGMEGRYIPPTVEQRTTLLRAQLADKRVLVIADDAASSAQVRPLIAATASSAILVTSRNRLADFPAARLLTVGPIADAEAAVLLGNIVGQERVNAERDEALALAKACNGIPLAIRIAGNKLACRPALPVAVLAAAVADKRQMLDQFSVGDMAMRASIDRSYERFDVPMQRVFLGLPQIEQRDISLADVVSVLGESPARVEQIMERLVDASILEPVARGSYRINEMLLAYAIDRQARETGAGSHIEER